MFKISRIVLLALAAALTTGAMAAAPTGTSADYGAAVAGAFAGRVIKIVPGAAYVHVVNGETVTFEVDGKSFSWHVETYPNVNEFALKTIAPAGLDVSNVRVVVAPNPIYLGS